VLLGVICTLPARRRCRHGQAVSGMRRPAPSRCCQVRGIASESRDEVIGRRILVGGSGSA